MAAPGCPSFGDIIAGVQVVIKAWKALDSAQGASFDYQDTLRNLDFVQSILREIQAIEQNSPYSGRSQRLQEYAGHCVITVTRFLERIKSYEKALSFEQELASRKKTVTTLLRKAPKRITWAMRVQDDVKKLKQDLDFQAGFMTLHLLMPMAQCGRPSGDVFCKPREQIAIDDAATTGDEVVHIQRQSSLVNQDAGICAREAFKKPAVNLRLAVGNKVEIDLQVNGQSAQQAMEGIMTMLMYVWQTMSILLLASKFLPRAPTMLLDTNIHITDALGQKLSLSFSDFKYWSILTARLDVQFNECPGNLKVKNRNFGFLTLDSKRQVLDLTNWDDAIYPGAKVAMVMFVLGTGRFLGECPRCGSKRHDTDSHGWSTCRICGVVHNLYYRSTTIDEKADEPEEACVNLQDPGGENTDASETLIEYDGDETYEEEERDMSAFKMVQWFTVPCLECSTPFTSAHQLLEHVDAQHRFASPS